MDPRRNASSDETPGAALASGFAWVQRTLRRQLDTLRRLGSAAIRLVENATRQLAPAPTSPALASIVALEKVLHLHDRVDWALRLIDALRAKLTADLQRLERGESPDLDLQAEASNDSEAAPQAVKTESLGGGKAEKERPERSEYERGDYERFNLGRGSGDREFADILKLPTDEVIALICRQLGLPADWPRLAEEAWERETAEEPLVSVDPLAPSRPPDG